MYVATATVAGSLWVKAPDYLKDKLIRAKLQFEGFDNATQPQKPHRESVQPVFAIWHVPVPRFINIQGWSLFTSLSQTGQLFE